MVRQLLKNELTDKQKEFIGFDKDTTQGLLKALSKAIVANQNSVGLPYWSEKDPRMVKDLTFALVKLGYGTVYATPKYSRFDFNMSRLDRKTVDNFRIQHKLRKFLMREDKEIYPSTLVRSNGTTKETGLVREGFAKAAKYTFKYDLDMLQKYHEPIRQSLIKSIRKAKEKGKLKDKYFADIVNYEQVVDYCISHYMLDGQYNLEYNTSDSRGRSIYNALKRVGNPVSSKDFRSLIVTPSIIVNRNNQEQMDDIFYFIAELLGSKAKSEATKIAQGKRWYNMRKIPEVDLATEEGRDDLHEVIWLERIYTKLERLNSGRIPFIEWDIPLEVDAGMSIAQIVGALTNEYRLLERTNVIGDTLTDPWFIEGVRRLAAKAVGTPTFYGSSQSAISLIKSKGLATDQEEIKAIRKEFATGGLAIMKQFKDAIIKNYNMHKPIIPMKIWGDTFNIEVNKFKPAGATIVVTEAWNGKRYVKSFTHKPVLIPDYEHMKLFWATCLIHNLDSQIVNNVAKDMDHWMLTIHDAIITLPGIAGQARKAYATQLQLVNDNRHSILKDFRKSIGATDIKADIAFMNLYKATQQAEAETFSPSAMK